MTLVACHEIGHSIGLVHSSGSTDVMKPAFASTEAFAGLSANDIGNIQTGYASGSGAVLTLNDTGIWVDGDYTGIELGTIAQPLDSVAEAVLGIPPFTTGVKIIIQAGTYQEPLPLVISSSCELVPKGGEVVLN